MLGDSILPRGGVIWLRQLIELAAPFGLSERLVRTSVFRLVAEGWLRARRHGRQSRYEVTDSGKRRFEQAYQKIYARPDLTWNGTWTLLLIAPNSLPPEARSSVRSELEWEGFRQLSPNLFGHPKPNDQAVSELIERLKIRRYVTWCTARDVNPASAQSLDQMVKSRWDFRPVSAAYRQFIKRFEPLSDILPEDHSRSPEQFFLTRSLLIHAFRRAVLHDPLLPEKLLPHAWVGTRAYELAGRIYQLTFDGAEQHLENVLGSSPRATRVPSRFGLNVRG
jgi:phenylacetic acid degradation operon negative regulatory protein